MISFCHLHLHTHYSLLDGATRIPALMKHVQSNGMDAVAMTDHGNLYGMIEFLNNAKYFHIKPIIGMEAYVAPHSRLDRSWSREAHQDYAYHLTLLACTGDGVRNLMRLSSRAFLEGYYYKPRIDREILAQHSDGLICLSGCASSELSDYLLNGDTAKARSLAEWYLQTFKSNFFFEIQNNGVSIQQNLIAPTCDLANSLGAPIVATSDAHYLTSDDAKYHDILLCINTKKTIHDKNRMRFSTNQFYVRSPAAMLEAMPDHADAIKQSAAIAASVEEFYPSLGLGKRQFPSFAVPSHHKNADAYLKALCKEAYPEIIGDWDETYLSRLGHELAIIQRMGFSSYFLIVHDICRFMCEHSIMYSARGSACGSLIAYLLHISRIDPLAHGLLFERFIDPARSEPPDIDLDIDKERRDEVIQYVRKRYGDDCVAHIGTFGTLKARGVIKDVGRAIGMDYPRVAEVSKLIPERQYPPVTLKSAFDEEPALHSIRQSTPTFQHLFACAFALEGTARSAGTHAAGIVIASEPLINLVPLQRLPARDKDSTPVISTQWSMNDVERVGLLKLDLLGLRNLTVLGRAIRLIDERHGVSQAIPDIYRLELSDERTYALLRSGDVSGIFQIEGAGIRDLLVRIRPDQFSDLVAILALYRPGPLGSGMQDEYVSRKHGLMPAQYDHPICEEILSPTYGLMIFQEQIMLVLHRLGGMDLTRSYSCIKAISKKIPEKVKAFREEFVFGATRNTGAKLANEIFSKVEHFSGYGFNKCISEDAIVTRAGASQFEDGPEITLKEMWEYWHGTLRNTPRGKKYRRQGLQILALDSDGRIRPKICKDIHNTGIQHLYKITLENGMSISATKEHRHLGVGGWRKVRDLKVGDELVINTGEKALVVGKPEAFREFAGKGWRKGRTGGAGDSTHGHCKDLAAITLELPNYCEFCGADEGRLERAHLDNDRSNNTRENVKRLCNSCHKKHDASRRGRWKQGEISGTSKIVSIEYNDSNQTYDLEMDDPGHNFVCNGILTHNSHATSYALLLYQTAYLKAHYPVEFMASLLSCEMDGSEREKFLAEHINNCRDMGITILGPDINKSQYHFTVERSPAAIRFGLGAIKGLGKSVVQSLIAARTSPFNSIGQILQRIPLEYSQLQKLIYAGCFDEINPDRAAWLETLKREVATAKKAAKDARRGQLSLFSGMGEADQDGTPHHSTNEQDRTVSKTIWLRHERNVLGFYLTGNPLDPYYASLAALSPVRIDQLETHPRSHKAILGCWITHIHTKNAKKSRGGPTRMAHLTLTDCSASIPATIWPDAYVKYHPLISADQPLFIFGHVDRSSGSLQLIIDQITNFSEGVSLLVQGLIISNPSDELQLSALRRACLRRPGNVSLYFEVGDVQLKSKYRVKYSVELIKEIESIVGHDSVRFLPNVKERV